MTVLIADKLEQSVVDGLTGRGFKVVTAPAASGDELVAKIGEIDPHVLVVRSTKVPADAMDAGSIELIVRAGAGYDNIDVAAASARGIFLGEGPTPRDDRHPESLGPACDLTTDASKSDDPKCLSFEACRF